MCNSLEFITVFWEEQKTLGDIVFTEVTKAQWSHSSIQLRWPLQGIDVVERPLLKYLLPSLLWQSSPVYFLLLSFVCDSVPLPNSHPCIVPITLFLFPHCVLLAFRATYVLTFPKSYDPCPDLQISRTPDWFSHFWMFCGHLTLNFSMTYFSEWGPSATTHYPSNWPLKIEYSSCCQFCFLKQPSTRCC